jgi:hypothetical protein
MISATTDQFGGHRTHFKGLSAILSSKSCYNSYLQDATAFEHQASPLAINSLSEVLIVGLTPQQHIITFLPTRPILWVYSDQTFMVSLSGRTTSVFYVTRARTTRRILLMTSYFDLPHSFVRTKFCSPLQWHPGRNCFRLENSQFPWMRNLRDGPRLCPENGC